MAGRSDDTGPGQQDGQEGGLTRRQFAVRSGAAAGSLAAGSLLVRALDATAAPAQTGVFTPEQVAVLSALLEARLAPPSSSSSSSSSSPLALPSPSVIDPGIEALAAVFSGYAPSIQGSLLTAISLVQAGAPGGSFTALAIDKRKAFIDGYEYPPITTAGPILSLPSLNLASQLEAVLAPVLAALAPTDPSTLEPPDELPPAPEPGPPSLSSAQLLAISVTRLFDFALLAYVPPGPPDTEAGG